MPRLLPLIHDHIQRGLWLAHVLEDRQQRQQSKRVLPGWYFEAVCATVLVNLRGLADTPRSTHSWNDFLQFAQVHKVM